MDVPTDDPDRLAEPSGKTGLEIIEHGRHDRCGGDGLEPIVREPMPRLFGAFDDGVGLPQPESFVSANAPVDGRGDGDVRIPDLQDEEARMGSRIICRVQRRTPWMEPDRRSRRPLNSAACGRRTVLVSCRISRLIEL